MHLNKSEASPLVDMHLSDGPCFGPSFAFSAILLVKTLLNAKHDLVLALASHLVPLLVKILLNAKHDPVLALASHLVPLLVKTLLNAKHDPVLALASHLAPFC